MATKQKLIAGHAFEIAQPYEAGHALNEAEAKTLNQVRSENIGNNVREKVKEFLEAGDIAGAVAYVTERDSTYVFTLSGTGTRTSRDPIETEARKIARDLIRQDLHEKGRKITVAPEGESQEDWEARVESEVDRISTTDDVVKAAKKAVADRQKRKDTLLSAVGGVSV